MSSHKKIVLGIIIAGILFACQTVNIPDAYNFRPREIKQNPYGCWITVEYSAQRVDPVILETSGELICIEKDTLYLLTGDGIVEPIFSGKISNAVLYTHKNQGGKYAGLTLAYLIPNLLGVFTEYGGSFLAVGLPVALVGFLNAIVEGSSSKSQLQYPRKATADQLSLYARFPVGRPDHVDFRQLSLKRTIK